MIIKNMRIRDAEVVVTDGIQQHPFTFDANITCDENMQVHVDLKITDGVDQKEMRERLANGVQACFKARTIKVK